MGSEREGRTFAGANLAGFAAHCSLDHLVELGRLRSGLLDQQQIALSPWLLLHLRQHFGIGLGLV